MVNNVKMELELLTRHMRILKAIYEKGPIGIIKLSKILNIPAHQVRYSMRILQQSGFLQPSTKGALLNQRAKTFIKGFETEKKMLIERLSKI